LVEDYDLIISDEDPDGITSVIIYGLYHKKIPNFISDVEKARRPVQIDFLSINIEEKEEQKTLVVRLEGRLPYFNLKE